LVGTILATALLLLAIAIAIAALSWGRLIAALLTPAATARLLTGVLLFLLCHHRLLRRLWERNDPF
jgi:hypothetical protein